MATNAIRIMKPISDEQNEEMSLDSITAQCQTVFNIIACTVACGIQFGDIFSVFSKDGDCMLNEMTVQHNFTSNEQVVHNVA